MAQKTRLVRSSFSGNHIERRSPPTQLSWNAPINQRLTVSSPAHFVAAAALASLIAQSRGASISFPVP